MNAKLCETAQVHRLHVCTLLHNQHWPAGRRLRCHAQSLLSFAMFAALTRFLVLAYARVYSVPSGSVQSLVDLPRAGVWQVFDLVTVYPMPLSGDDLNHKQSAPQLITAVQLQPVCTTCPCQQTHLRNLPDSPGRLCCDNAGAPSRIVSRPTQGKQRGCLRALLLAGRGGLTTLSRATARPPHQPRALSGSAWPRAACASRSTWTSDRSDPERTARAAAAPPRPRRRSQDAGPRARHPAFVYCLPLRRAGAPRCPRRPGTGRPARLAAQAGQAAAAARLRRARTCPAQGPWPCPQDRI